MIDISGENVVLVGALLLFVLAACSPRMETVGILSLIHI